MFQADGVDNRAFIKELTAYENHLVRLFADEPGTLSKSDESVVRWALSLGRVSAVLSGKKQNEYIEIGHATDVYRKQLCNLLAPFADKSKKLNKKRLSSRVPAVFNLLVAERKELNDLYRHNLDLKALDTATQSRPLALALSGGGGTSFVFIGALNELHKAGIRPEAIAGTSMGAMIGAYRASQETFDLDRLLKMLIPLGWDKVAKPLHFKSRFGLPATFKLFLREIFGDEFQLNKRAKRINELTIPFRAAVSGVAHIEGQPDPDFEMYGHLLDGIEPKVSSVRTKQKGLVRAIMDLTAKPLVPIYIGQEKLTEEFDVIDAIGFSGAVPGLFNYDIPEEDKRMSALTESLIKEKGVVRLFDGGFVDNLPAVQAKEAIQLGPSKIKDPFVLALDGFAPNLHQHWMFLPLMKISADKSKAGYKAADLAITYRQVLSPLNLFPSKLELDRALQNGTKETVPYMPFIKKILSPIPRPVGLK